MRKVKHIVEHSLELYRTIRHKDFVEISVYVHVCLNNIDHIYKKIARQNGYIISMGGLVAHNLLA